MAVTTQCLKETKDAVKLAVTSAAESVYQQLSEWAVLAEVALVMVPGSVEAERMFSTMSFLNTQGAEPADHTPRPLRTDLQPEHLQPGQLPVRGGLQALACSS